MKSLFQVACKTLLVLTCSAFVSTELSAQTWQEQVGYDKLVAELGPGVLETGLGITVSMTEADINVDAALFQYMPDPAAFVAGQSAIDGSGINNSGFSGHSTGIARTFIGTASIAQGPTAVTVYEANDYINRVLGTSTGLDPLTSSGKIQNHSWVGSFGNSPGEVAAAENALQRLDFMINRDDVSIAVGLNNGTGAHPQLLGQSYNAIAVGRTDGDHSRGTTSIYGAGRTKPDIVSPTRFTSGSTARVSSILSVLHEKAVNDGNTDASRAVVIKSILMGGATKDEFADWDRTTTRPLDEIYGAGESDIYNSYKILDAGETDGSTVVGSAPMIDVAGFDYGESLDIADSMYYNFEIGARETWEDVSLMLNWNIDVTDLDPTGDFNPTTDLADFSLRLYDSTGAPLDTLLDSSLSTVDNVEHIFAESLGPGLYTVEISTDTTHDFAFSWFARSVPEPNSALIVLAFGGFMATRRRRNG